MINLGNRPAYLDIRSEFWRELFNKALEYEAYLADNKSEHIKRWRDSEARIPDLSKRQLNCLRGYSRNLNVLVYSGIWCGDCSRQGPLLKVIADACGDDVKLRFIDRETSTDLKDELRIVGATRVPIVVFFSEDFWEIARFGERTLSIYRAKAARDIGRKFDAGILSPKARERELAEWTDIFERVLIMLRLSPPLRKKYGD
ncbi:thiol reductase thioredoxin [Candidatus Bathyarchaeota archaeon]|nr:thiol reductase thioredoxin [Candidatus Bathyarchaeota archaeon]